jgi:cGMP-dependent protein kinase
MLECSSPWLVNLVATAQDDKNIYMLLEAVMGGELFAYLQVRLLTKRVNLLLLVMQEA